MRRLWLLPLLLCACRAAPPPRAAAPPPAAPPAAARPPATPPDAAQELTLADGSLVRASAGSRLRLDESGRSLELTAGTVLVHTDRMLGGLRVLTPVAACIPEGTTYLVRAETTPPSTTVAVLEGVVQVVAGPAGPGLAGRGGALEPQARLVVHGESLLVRPPAPLGAPQRYDLDAALRDEPLLREPLAARARISALAAQQRSGVLERRAQRLRREIRWQRPRTPLVLPAPFLPTPRNP